MKKYILLTTVLLISVIGYTQTKEPKIGTEKGVKEKLLLIKKGLPDIKKNLTEQDLFFLDHFKVKFEMGNGIVVFDEEVDEEEGDEEDEVKDKVEDKNSGESRQSLTIRYTPSYFSGTVAEYQDYYKRLVVWIKEVFGTEYVFSSDNGAKRWTTVFFQKGKKIDTSDITISVSCSWIVESLGPNINLEIYSRMK